MIFLNAMKKGKEGGKKLDFQCTLEKKYRESGRAIFYIYSTILKFSRFFSCLSVPQVPVHYYAFLLSYNLISMFWF